MKCLPKSERQVMCVSNLLEMPGQTVFPVPVICKEQWLLKWVLSAGSAPL